jgi:hypothetical protein
MNTQTNDGGSAFPVPPQQFNQFLVGMTLRDYFAAAALQGMLADPSNGLAARSSAKSAYIFADAMLTQRKLKKDNETTSF